MSPRTGLAIAVVGMLVVLLSVVPFLVTVALSGNPDPNPVVQNMVLWLGGALGFTIVFIGFIMAAALHSGPRPR